jgi:hypothetical protein
MHRNEGAIYSREALAALEQTVSPRENMDFYAWQYPPIALLLVYPLASSPYLWSLALWLTVGVVCYLTVLVPSDFPGQFLPRRTAMCISAVPAPILAGAAVFSLYAWALFLSTFSHPGAIGLNLNAPGTDWMVFYEAARLFFEDRLGLIFDGQRFTAELNATFSGWLSQPLPYRPWIYPPTYLLLLLPFGKLPFGTAYAAFQLATALLLVVALWSASDRPGARGFVAIAVLLSPAAAINIAVGQNAFFTAALLVIGFRQLQRRPMLAGAALGLLTVKPQFWLLVPVALLASRQWRVLAASLISAALLAAASAAVLGHDIWVQWVTSSLATYNDATGQWMETGRLWGDSVYACLVAAGAPHGVANAGQFGALVLAAAITFLAFCRPLRSDSRLAIILAAAILAAPHSSIHETVFLAIAALLWISATAEGTPIWQWIFALALWLAPIFNPPLVTPVGRLTPILILAYIAIALRGRSHALAHSA